jgi:putative tricarboxylic transport membrane protein
MPFTPAMAVVLGALLLHNITPGPNLIGEKPQLFWGVIASMYIGNFMLLVLNLPLVNVFVSILKVPRQILLPVIVLLCLVGVYSVNASYVDLMVLVIFGLVGYALRGLGFQPAPLILATVIGPMIETSLRQSLKMTGGSIGGLIFRPICLTLYIAVICTFVVPMLVQWVRDKKRPASSAPVS